MNGVRAGIALPAALAGVVVLGGLAALANVAAIAAVRESAALRDAVRADASRAVLRARAARQVARVARAQLLAAPRLIAQRDTTLVISGLAWPWHRLTVFVEGTPVIAEFVRAEVPSVPWCAGVVVGGASVIAPSALSIAPSSGCGALSAAASPSAIAAFDSAVVASLILAPPADTVALAILPLGPAVYRARRAIEIAPSAIVSGLVIAPCVTVAAGAMVRGMIVARDTLVVSAGANVVADELAVNAALAGAVRLTPLGRRGLLLPP